MNNAGGKSACPVHMILFSAFLAASSCGGPGEKTEGVPASPRSLRPVVSTPAEVEGFEFEASHPDTLSLKWDGEGPGEVEQVLVHAGDAVHSGDTLLFVMEDVRSVLVQRLLMEHDIASALSSVVPNDTSVSSRLDSLVTLLDSLRMRGGTPFVSSADGTVARSRRVRGERVIPGTPLFDLSVAGDSLVRVYAPGSVAVSSWPKGTAGVRLVEDAQGHAVYSGTRFEVEGMFRSLRAVERVALFDSDMRSYVVTVNGDTIPVERLGTVGTAEVLVLPQLPLDRSLRTWSRE